nr:PREDICTED: CKLF-like MARVEL transmembrane domain-containing protein 7 [Struthio camelus australis]
MTYHASINYFDYHSKNSRAGPDLTIMQPLGVEEDPSTDFSPWSHLFKVVHCHNIDVAARMEFGQDGNVSLLVGFISVNSSQWTDYSAYSYFQIVTMCDLVMILFFYIVHIFRIYKLLTCISWPLAEFLHYLIGTVLLLIASIVAASKSYNLTDLLLVIIFGFLATVLCVLSIWSSYKVSCITQSTDEFVCGKPSDTGFLFKDAAV